MSLFTLTIILFLHIENFELDPSIENKTSIHNILKCLAQSHHLRTFILVFHGEMEKF